MVPTCTGCLLCAGPHGKLLQQFQWKDMPTPEYLGTQGEEEQRVSVFCPVLALSLGPAADVSNLNF